MTTTAPRPLLELIGDLSSAEEFFVFFLLPFEQDVVNISRLHIMKRMGQYLANSDFSNMSDDEIFLEARRHLKAAYQDFVESSPLEEKVFKVFKDQENAMKGRFVGIENVSLAAAE